jgi:hypothetical protein
LTRRYEEDMRSGGDGRQDMTTEEQVKTRRMEERVMLKISGVECHRKEGEREIEAEAAPWVAAVPFHGGAKNEGTDGHHGERNDQRSLGEVEKER